MTDTKTAQERHYYIINIIFFFATLNSGVTINDDNKLMKKNTNILTQTLN